MLGSALPIYPLYALLFTGTGLSVADVSVLFAVWGGVAIVAEVPSGALADRFSRRAALVAAAVLEAAAFALWVVAPSFTGFAVGFVLWGIGGALESGAQEALLHDGLAAVGAEEHYALVQGRVTAASLLSELPAAGAATVLFPLGGYQLVGWVSVGACLASAALATRLPEPPRAPADADDGPGYLAVLRAGVVEAAASPPVRAAVIAVALLTGLDAVEEYLPLLAASSGVPTGLVPAALLVVTVAAAAGAALAGAGAALRPAALAVVLAVAALGLGAAGLVGEPVALLGVAVFYGLYRFVLVIADARLQARIESGSRATVTSVASLGTELAAFVVYPAWALGGASLVAVLTLLVAAALPRWLAA